MGEKNPGELRRVVGLSPEGTANGEGSEGPPPPEAAAAAGDPMAPTRSWVKEPWKDGDAASGKSAAARVRGPGLVSAPAAAVDAEPAVKRDSMAERGGRDSAGRGGRRASSPAAEASRAAMEGGGMDAASVPSEEGLASSLSGGESVWEGDQGCGFWR